MRTTYGLSAVILCGAMIAAGCNDTTTKPTPPDKDKGKEVAKTSDSKHSEWWCNEHGIPEAECSMCSPKVAKAFKDKGDWCDKHDRAKSQCFICDPKLKEKFAAVYRAKYGKEPPPIEEEDEKKDDKKGDKEGEKKGEKK